MLNDRQRSLVVLLIICTGFISTIITMNHGEVHSFWVLYQIPAYLLVMLAPNWTVSWTIVASVLTLKYTTMFVNAPEILESTRQLAKAGLVSSINISLFLAVSYFIIAISRKVAKMDKEIDEYHEQEHEHE